MKKNLFLLAFLLPFWASTQVIYLHTHQTTYLPGETIHGKWYLLPGANAQPPVVNLYADWFDDAGALLQHQVWLIQNNTGAAQFKVPADYKGKFLRVVPYTLGAQNHQALLPEQVIFIRPDAFAGQATTQSSAKQLRMMRHTTNNQLVQIQLDLTSTDQATDTVFLQRWSNGQLKAIQPIVLKEDAQSEWDFDRQKEGGQETFQLVNSRGEVLDVFSLPSTAAAVEPLKLELATKSFAPKGRNEWVLEATDSLWTSLSVAVVDASSYVPVPSNITTHRAYWQKQPQLTAANVDAWIQVKGQIKGRENLPEKLKLTAGVFSPGQLPQMATLPIGEDGSFLFPGIYAIDSAYLSMQLDYPGKGKKAIEVQYAQLGQFQDAPRFNDRWTYHQPVLHLPPGTKKPGLFVAPAENEVVVYSKVKSDAQLMDEKYSHGLFRGGDAIALDLLKKETHSFPSIFHYLQGKIPGLQIFFVGADPNSFGGDGALPSSPSSGGISTPAPRPVSITGGNNAPRPGGQNLVGGAPVLQWRAQERVQIFLNEVPTDASTLMTIPMTELAYVKAFRPPFMGAALGAPGGAIAVYTRVGDEKDPFYESNRLTNLKIKGYTGTAPYEQPNYQLAKNRAWTDNRVSLFWDANVVLGAKNPRQKLVFYNNDSARKFKLVVEGIRQDGTLVHLEKEIQ